MSGITFRTKFQSLGIKLLAFSFINNRLGEIREEAEKIAKENIKLEEGSAMAMPLLRRFESD